MRKTLNILASSLHQTWNELKLNKTRTALSLTGVAFGIFCIIGVLATVNSLERNIQDQLKSLGSNTIYIDRWIYGGNSTVPFWKLRARPVMKFEEKTLIVERSELLDKITFLLQSQTNIGYKDALINGITMYGIDEDQMAIQPIEFEAGRYVSASEFHSGAPVCLLGYTNAEDLFGIAGSAVGKMLDVKGRKVRVVGVIKKVGQNFVGWDFDNSVMLPYKFSKMLVDDQRMNPIFIAKGKEGVTAEAFTDELRGIMRQIRRLSPREEDNFALNSVEALSKQLSDSFVTFNIVGAIIGGISLIVGMFGIANIMFVTVKERTSVIGLKKAIGAKRKTILAEFLIEAVLLCIAGGMAGLVFVYLLTLLLSGPLEFPVYVSVPMIFVTIIICLVVGVLAGIIPASRAAKMDPVVAIRK
ncbi:MAG TPA: ABC transporter permease [Petrimonas sp.]|nr:ABC transporter permease [Petrimonas sp.]